jgi:hypothetical protein
MTIGIRLDRAPRRGQRSRLVATNYYAAETKATKVVSFALNLLTCILFLLFALLMQKSRPLALHGARTSTGGSSVALVHKVCFCATRFLYLYSG